VCVTMFVVVIRVAPLLKFKALCFWIYIFLSFFFFFYKIYYKQNYLGKKLNFFY